jgi:D-alanyl-D-alanine carboxypeptidase
LRLACGAAAAIFMLAASFSALADAAVDDSPFILVDVQDATVLADRQAEQRWYPASLTKLMTAYVTFRAIAEGTVTPETKVTMTAAAVAQPAVKMGFKAGATMKLDDALKMMIVPSANDIAVAVAEAVGGNLAAFVARMNEEAARLGMSDTHFENPNGLPAGAQVSTARDLAVLARQIWVEFPEHQDLFGIQAIKSGSSVFHSPNLMLLERYAGAQGMKTGFTCAAGYNLAAMATRKDRTLLAIVLGRISSRDRAELAARLLDRGFADEPDDEPITLTEFADTGSDPGPVDMQICRGTGVDRVGFTDTALGPVVVVNDPVVVAANAVLAKPVASAVARAKPPAPAASKAAAAPSKSGATSTAKLKSAKPPASAAKPAPAKASAVARPKPSPRGPSTAGKNAASGKGAK